MPNPWTDTLPTFEATRRRAHRELGGVLDALQPDQADSLTGDQLAALAEARQHITAAREALNRAVG